MATKTKRPTKKSKPAGPKPQVVRRPMLGQVERFLEPLPIDKMRLITLGGREFVAVKHLNASPKLWTWQLGDGSLCWFPSDNRAQLLADAKPSPEAKLVRVRIVRSW